LESVHVGLCRRPVQRHVRRRTVDFGFTGELRDLRVERRSSAACRRRDLLGRRTVGEVVSRSDFVDCVADDMAEKTTMMMRRSAARWVSHVVRYTVIQLAEWI